MQKNKINALVEVVSDLVVGWYSILLLAYGC